jgi:glycosyltransferase involved in cell wall biosynthesis
MLMDHPIQHFAPALRLLAAHPEVEISVYYWDAATDGLYDPAFGCHVRWNTDLHSGYAWWSPPGGGSALLRRLAVARSLSRDRPEAILSFGWAAPIARLGVCYAALTRTPLLYYGDSNWRTSARGGNSLARRVALRMLFRASGGALASGGCNRQFYLMHGMAPERVHTGVFPTDVDAFRVASERSRPDPAAGAATRPLVIGFAGKFLDIKAVDDLVEAAARLPRQVDWEVWLIGDGPERPRLEALVRERGLAGRVRFHGFRNTDELPALFAAIDIMVLPSRREARGQVAIEAMAAGAAVVVSSATGVWGPGDAVVDGESGLVFPSGDIDALSAGLRRLMDPRLRARLAGAGQSRAQSYRFQDFAATTAAALVAVASENRHATVR